MTPNFRVKTGITAGSVTVYGSPSCGWTKKQLDDLKTKGTSYKFVDCAQEKCPDFVSGFPTTIIAGYQKI